MDPKLDAIERIREQLEKIELGVVNAYDGFKNIRWHADVFMVWAEMVGVAPRLPAEVQGAADADQSESVAVHLPVMR
jgi:hypothetical protein